MSTLIDHRALAFVPFGYALQTRIRSPRSLVNTVATGWIPAVVLIWQLGGQSLPSAALSFLFSYLCFISIYELGYYYNDTLGTRHDEVPRRRFCHQLSFLESGLFVLLRLLVFGLLAFNFGWLGDPLWQAFYLVLVLLLVAHNLLRSVVLKFCTFLQMSVLRFMAPVLPWLEPNQLAAVAVIGFLFFTYNRFITYMAGKERLQIPEKKRGWYLVSVQVLFLPAVGLMSVLSGEMVYLYLAVYFVVLYGAFYLVPQIGERLAS